MSEPKTRYHRGIEVIDFQVKPLTRYERLDRVFTTVLKEVMAGSDLKVVSQDKRIQISLGTKGTWDHLTLEIGLRAIGDLLERNIGAITPVAGECPGIDPIDQELLAGASLIVTRSHDKVKVCWIRTLPPQEVELKSGGKHLFNRKGTRVTIQEESNILELIRSALAAPEHIEKSSVLTSRTDP
jgi:hypothetical protein